ncbi:MAG: S1-like domain-containing RNA-binding protein [Chromatiales bacterium]|nr:S1-like domain-containing RNA-binding protein [Chromatiales bacterium]
MIEIGHDYTLKVVKILDFGAYLDAGELGEVLLPRRYMTPDLAVGDMVPVFLYLDSDNLPVATTQRAKAELGEFAYLQVSDLTDVGAFLDWGLDKDLFVPFAEQHRPMEVGKSYIVHLYLDVKGRITASSKIDKFLQDDGASTFRPRQRVSLIIANSTDLGYKVIVNHTHWGVLYKDEVFERLSFGQSKQGFIKRIRPDGRLDITLHGGKETKDKNAAKVLEYLKTHNGTAPLHDKSPPAEIEAQLAMSKAAFKKAISSLYKERVIIIEKDGIRLV